MKNWKKSSSWLGAVALVTGHEEADKPGSLIDWPALARFPGTLVFYMAIARLEAIVAALLEHGKAPATPAAAIERGSTPEQRTVTAALVDLPGAVRREAIQAPGQMTYGSQAAAASQVFEQQRDLALRERASQQLALVDAAIERLQAVRQKHECRLGRAGVQEALESTGHAAKNLCERGSAVRCNRADRQM